MKRSKIVSFICIILSVTVLTAAAMLGIIFLFAQESDTEESYYNGKLNSSKDLVLYKISSDHDLGNVYFKTQSFGDYNGKNWSSNAVEYDKLLKNKYSASYLPSFVFERSDMELYQVHIEPTVNKFILPYYADPYTGQVQTSDVKCIGDASGAYDVLIYDYDDTDKVFPFMSTFAEYKKDYEMFVQENYTYIDPDTEAYIADLLSRLGFSGNHHGVVDDVMDYVKKLARYDLAYDTALDSEENVAIAFMDGKYESGVCRHFASAATLMLRALGIPARYTVGYMTRIHAGQTSYVTSLNSHAWVEVYDRTLGWLKYDPTPPMSLPIVPPTDDTPLYMLRSTLSDTLLLKCKSYCNYNDGVFDEAYTDRTLMNGQYSAYYLASMALEESKYDDCKYGTLSMTPLSDNVPYLLPYYMPVDDLSIDNGIQKNDRVIEGDASSKYVITYCSYNGSEIPKGNSQTFLEMYSTYTRYVEENYRYLSQNSSDIALRIIHENGLVGDTIEESVNKVVKYLTSNYTYVRSLEVKEGTDFIKEFLLGKTKCGTSREFAGAATIILRQMGIPARFTEGYRVKALASQDVCVRGTDIYYWVEVYYEDCGWMPCDVLKDLNRKIERETAYITLEDTGHLYDGKTAPLPEKFYGFEAYEMQGYKLSLELAFDTDAIVPGRYATHIVGYTVKDRQGNDVTDEFIIKLSSGGTVTVYDDIITVSSGSYSTVYDGLSHDASNVKYTAVGERYRYSISGQEDDGEIDPSKPFGATLVIYDSDASIVNVGTKKVTFSVKTTSGDRGAYYMYIYEGGHITVTKREIEISAASKSISADDVDGTFTYPYYTITKGSLAEGDYIETCTVSGSVDGAGRADNKIDVSSIVIRNSAGEDVTQNYSISTVNGKIEVYI